MSQLLTTKEVADRLGVEPKTVLRYLHQGKLQGSKIGREYRIPERSLNSLLAPADIRPSPNGTRQARITAIVNQKGGVGKTTTTFNLGVALQRRGRQVLLVDLDPQASLSVSAGINIGQLKKSVYQLLLDPDLDPHEVVFTTQTGVSILPSTIDLAAAEVELVTMTLRELVLKDALDQLQGDFDHILIDCPPSLGLLTINALAAADQVLIPLQCEFLATRGLALLLRTLDQVQSRLNRDLTIAGILPTMFDVRTIHANEVLTELRESFPEHVFDIVVKSSVRVKESPAAGLSILDYDEDHDVAQAYRQLAEEVDNG